MTKKTAMYVDNQHLLEHLTKRRKLVQEAIARGEEKPPLDNYLGKVILDVANKLSYRPNFINYSFKSCMISDAIENLVKAIDNFDPEKSKYPFAYMTTIAWQAFVRRILTEKRQQKIKRKIIETMPLDDLMSLQEHDEDGVEYRVKVIDYLRENNFLTEDGSEVKVEAMVKDMEPEGLEVFMEEDDEQDSVNN